MTHPAVDLAAWRSAPALDADPRPGTRALADSALGALGIELLRCDAAEVVARMPAPTSRAGTSLLLVLAETVASTAAGLAAGPARRAFGAELDASLLATPEPGPVIAVAAPLLLDPTRHTWRITAVDGAGTTVLEARCTLGIVDAPTGD